MNPESQSATVREERLQEILLAYVEAAESGKAPPRREMLERHPEFATELADFLAGRAEVEQLAGPLRRLATGRPSNGGLVKESPAAAPVEGDIGQIGDFRLLREIGRGGMGVVYEAEQISLRRRVALKVLPFAAALHPKQLQRFKNEAQAAAQLHHTNIVPVHAVGCERGVHYYAMQYIEGQSLAALIEALRPQGPGERTQVPLSAAPTSPQIPSSDQPASNTGPVTVAGGNRTTEIAPRRGGHYRLVARLGRTAAEALEHAHQIGVVHRDIKPANLLLDPRGNLWITDFGLALVRGDANLTMSGELVGTLRYMSPEQASARPGMVDHRTDVYSLGVTLYELLTLQPLFDGEGRQGLLHQIIDEEPLPPRFWDRAIPLELETIILKGIAKNPNDRYATAQDFADDLERFLDDRPILAKRPSLIDRVRKWGRRHKSVVVSGIVLAVVALAGLGISTVLLAQEAAKTHKAFQGEQKRGQEAQEARARAEKNFEKARQAVDFFTQISAEELAGGPFPQGLRRRMLEVALVYYQDFIDQCQDDPALRAELAESKGRVARILGELTTMQSPVQLLLLQDDAIQVDLKLSVKEKQDLGDLARRQNENQKKLRTLTAKERNAATLEFAKTAESRLAELLTTEKSKRLEQIVLQLKARGPQGFAHPEVGALLKLTSEQKENNRAVREEAQQKLWARFDERGFGLKQGKGRLEDLDIQEKAHERCLDTLTPEQRQRWRELTGEPVVMRGSLRQLVPGFDGMIGGGFGPPFPGPGGPDRGKGPPP